jgi:hypothetical protein
MKGTKKQDPVVFNIGIALEVGKQNTILRRKVSGPLHPNQATEETALGRYQIRLRRLLLSASVEHKRLLVDTDDTHLSFRLKCELLNVKLSSYYIPPII